MVNCGVRIYFLLIALYICGPCFSLVISSQTRRLFGMNVRKHQHLFKNPVSSSDMIKLNDFDRSLIVSSSPSDKSYTQVHKNKYWNSIKHFTILLGGLFVTLFTPLSMYTSFAAELSPKIECSSPIVKSGFMDPTGKVDDNGGMCAPPTDTQDNDDTNKLKVIPNIDIKNKDGVVDEEFGKKTQTRDDKEDVKQPTSLISPTVTANIEDDDAASLLILVESYEEKLESNELKQRREPKTVMQNIKKKLSPSNSRGRNAGRPLSSSSSLTLQSDVSLPSPFSINKNEIPPDVLADSKERILTLKAYLDEIERDLFAKNWDNLQVYLYTFADQENAFVALIDGLFPSDDKLDQTAREALSFEARSMFIALDDLREAAKNKSNKLAQGAYSRLLLSYDRFLKAGDLYPTYDPITSTAVFFEETNNDKSTLRFDASSKVQVLDTVLLTEGPDMGKTGTVINIEGDNAVVKLDKDGKAYQEVKYIKTSMLAKTLDSDSNNNNNNNNKNKKNNSNNKNNQDAKKKKNSSVSTKSS